MAWFTNVFNTRKTFKFHYLQSKHCKVSWFLLHCMQFKQYSSSTIEAIPPDTNISRIKSTNYDKRKTCILDPSSTWSIFTLPDSNFPVLDKSIQLATYFYKFTAAGNFLHGLPLHEICLFAFGGLVQKMIEFRKSQKHFCLELSLFQRNLKKYKATKLGSEVLLFWVSGVVYEFSLKPNWWGK